MDILHEYVPKMHVVRKLQLPDGSVLEQPDVIVYTTLLSGDLLTARSAIAARANHDSSVDQLRGFLPTVEDWHARMTLLKVRFSNRLFNCVHVYYKQFGVSYIITNHLLTKDHFFN
jgi:hypothetical protein